MKKQRLFGLMTACVMSLTAFPLSASAASVGDVLQVNPGHQQEQAADLNGYSYEIWQDTTGGNGSMTLGEGGNFSTEWNCQVSRGNFLARRGRRFDCTKTYDQYGTITCEYDCEWSASNSGNSRVCVYGWTTDDSHNELVEYYIVEDWANWYPPDNGNSQPLKTVTIDDAQYKIYTATRTNEPSIFGTKTFQQYFSVRSTPRHSGKISVSEHFKAWESCNLKLQKLYEVALNIEGWESSGKANVTKNIVTVGDSNPDPNQDDPNQDDPNQDNPQQTDPQTPAGDLTTIASHQNNDYTYDENGDKFKDYMGKFFRLGTCISGNTVNDGNATRFILENFNSITCENEMKPDYICDKSRSYGDNIGINLSRADSILKFAEKNGLGVRGHTFVWYSQTPGWIFRENFNDNGAFVSKERMNARLESMIKNTFDEIKKNYPNLKLYAYDVCNELFQNDGGGFRGDGKEFSNWWSVYHSDEFVVNAFKYARQYAPEGCKLYMNDYNEYFVAKCDDLYNMAKKILAEGNYIDGIGMQSHMHYCDFGFSGSATVSKDSKFMPYADAIDKFNSLGLDVQITELDVTTCSKQEGKDLFVDIFKVAMERSKSISSLTLWGHCDAASWRRSYTEDDGKGTQGGDPLPFDSSCRAKDFYYDIAALRNTVQVIEPGEPTPEVTLLGDVDCSGSVDIADAIVLARYNAEDKDVTVSAQGKANADTCADGDINQDDLTYLLEFLAGLRDL